MGKTHYYECAKCDEERQSYDWWPNWFPGPCPSGGQHEWAWVQRDPGKKLHRTLDLLEKKEALLGKQMEALDGQVRAELQKGTPEAKTKAKALLKKKKVLEAQQGKVQQEQANLERMVATLEEAELNKMNLDAQVSAAQSLKGLDADQVQEDLEHVRDTMQLADEVSAALAQPVLPDMTDEDELMAEFNALQMEVAKEQLGGAPLPEPPVQAVREEAPPEPKAEAEAPPPRVAVPA